MNWLTQWMDRAFYPAYGDSWDDSLFRNIILSHLTHDSDVLDLGAGRGARDQMNFRGHCKFIAGVDPDPAVLENPNLDVARVQTPPRFKIPFPKSRFDVVFSNSVIEHVSGQHRFFAEVKRVLRPGGLFLAKTPNKYHYVALFARCTPHWFHDWYNQLRGRTSRDTFPTTYTCNCLADIQDVSKQSGMKIIDIEFVEGRPEYLRLWFPTYLVGLAYERAVNMFSFMSRARSVILIQLQKPVETTNPMPVYIGTNLESTLVEGQAT